MFFKSINKGQGINLSLPELYRDQTGRKTVLEGIRDAISNQ